MKFVPGDGAAQEEGFEFVLVTAVFAVPLAAAGVGAAQESQSLLPVVVVMLVLLFVVEDDNDNDDDEAAGL